MHNYVLEINSFPSPQERERKVLPQFGFRFDIASACYIISHDIVFKPKFFGLSFRKIDSREAALLV